MQLHCGGLIVAEIFRSTQLLLLLLLKTPNAGAVARNARCWRAGGLVLQGCVGCECIAYRL